MNGGFLKSISRLSAVFHECFKLIDSICEILLSTRTSKVNKRGSIVPTFNIQLLTQNSSNKLITSFFHLQLSHTSTMTDDITRKAGRNLGITYPAHQRSMSIRMTARMTTTIAIDTSLEGAEMKTCVGVSFEMIIFEITR